MIYLGDFALGKTFDVKFNTTSSGVPITLAGSPVISAYVGNSVTQLTAGITLTVDLDGLPGFHNVRVVATSGNGYASATDVTLVITAGTVDSASMVGMIVAAFSIEARSALRPLTADRTLDVTAANKVNGVVLVDTVTSLTNAPTVGDLTAAMKASVNVEVLDVLNVDTFAEPGQEAPAATNTLAKKISYLFKLARNRVTQNSTTLKVYGDNGTTVDQKATVSDDGSVYDRGEIGTGP